jgi:hypothetical protein
VPIHCEHINLDEVLEGLPAERTTFPMRPWSPTFYLAATACGLPTC